MYGVMLTEVEVLNKVAPRKQVAAAWALLLSFLEIQVCTV